MFSFRPRLLIAGFFAALLALASLSAAVELPAVKRAHKLPPSADLLYAVTAKHSGLTLKGNTRIRWTASSNRFDIAVETKAGLLGTMLASHSEGTVSEYGLAPLKLTEKRFRKPPHTVTFGREDRMIRFSESASTYPIKGGEQDRTSISWQLVSIARAAPDRLTPGSELKFVVAGRKEAEIWSFRVMGPKTVSTPMGNVTAIHISKLPSPSREQQQLDLWLAPSLEWYPVRILFKDSNGTDLDQVLQRIDKK